MHVIEGLTYCGADAQPRTSWSGEPEGIDGETRRIISVDGDQILFQRRHGPPESMPMAEFAGWAIHQVAFLMGRWAIVDPA